jgi:hypothetical protein
VLQDVELAKRHAARYFLDLIVGITPLLWISFEELGQLIFKLP